MRLLLIEDYPPLSDGLSQYMREAGFVVDSVLTGDEGLWAAESNFYDVVMLDLMLPNMDGLSILRKLRQSGNGVPVFVMSARDGLDDRLEAFGAGADEYLVKPFAMSESLARVRALLRRHYAKKDPVIRVADLEVDTIRRTVRKAGQPLVLSPLEYRLLEYLAYRSGEVVPRAAIWEHVFEDGEGGRSNAVDVYISYLRKKLRSRGGPYLIHTRRGHGFLLGMEGA